MKNIGIIGAMDEEIENLLNKLTVEKEEIKNNIIFYLCSYDNKKIIIVKSGIGKVNSAVVTQILISNYNPCCIINTGIAGAISKDVTVLDLVIASETMQYDVHVSNFGYNPGQIPRMKEYIFKTDQYLTDKTKKSMGKDDKYHIGRIISGDKFISNIETKENLSKEFNALCADMESGSIGQVCYINKTPYIAIRCISDNADESSIKKYKDFDNKAAFKSSKLILSLLNRI